MDKKKILIIALSIAGIIACINFIPGNKPATGNPQNSDTLYCSTLRDGIMVVTMNGTQITNEVVLSDGSKLKPDGNLISKDGHQIMLEKGRCVSQSGELTYPPVK